MALNAIFTGSAGIQSNSQALDVVGNNLANTNTIGFKSQRIQFNDLVYQTLSSGSGPSDGNGGINPAQLGFGVGVGAIASNFAQGNLNSTGRNLDFGIQGSGFFVLSNGTRNVYSRNGAFDVDATGFLTDPSTGLRVQRFGNTGETSAVNPGFQTAGDLNIRVPFGAGINGNSTTTVQMQGNLNATMTIGDTYNTAIQIFDSQSTGQSLNVTFTKTAANTFQASATVSNGTIAFTNNTFTFDNTGLLATPAGAILNATMTSPLGNQAIAIDLGTIGQSVGLTQFGSPSSAAAVSQDGRGSGTLSSVSIDSNGTIQGIFSNGRTVPVAQLALAVFNNNGGLIREGSNYFAQSAASGEALIGPATSGGRGSIQGGALEGSNVDIAIEFSRLIISQRGFQVAARTVTVGSEVLEELANIIR